MLADWPDAGRIDSGRIGLFGFSVGGYTGLVVIGGNPDFRKGHPRCARTDLRALPVCSQLENGELPREAPHMIHASRQQSSSIPGRHSCCLPIISRP